MPDITARELVAFSNYTNLTEYTTAPIDPQPNRLVLAHVSTRSGAAGTPTLTGCGLTWVHIGTVTFDFGKETHLYRAMGSSPTEEAVTIRWPTTAECCVCIIAEFNNVDTSGTHGSGAIVQVATDSTGDGGGTASATITLAAFADATKNAAYAAIRAGDNQAIDGEAGWTVFTQPTPGETTTARAQWRLGEDTTATFSFPVRSTAWGGFAVEIKAAAEAPPEPAPYFFARRWR